MRSVRNETRFLACIPLCLVWALPAWAGPAGWPGWRGPTGDGVSDEVPQKMPAVRLVWKRPMAGRCSAGVSAAEGYVVVADHAKKTDHYRCYIAETGKEAWTFSVANAAKMDYGGSPRATPLIYRGKVYCVGAAGDVHCLGLKTGKAIWEKHYREDFGAGRLPVWGHCTAPVIVDGKLILHPGKVVALEAATGKTAWTGEASGPNYSTFVVGTFGGVKQLIGYDAKSLAAWDARTGQRVWELEADNSKGYIVPGVVVLGKKLLVATEDEDARLYGFDKKGKLIDKPEAENEDLAPEMATPTVQGDLVLGICEGLVCLDPANKLKTLWIHEKEDAFYGLSHIVSAKDRALVFGANGTMVLVKADRKKCTVLGKTKLCRNTWSHPALTGGRVYLRDEKLLYCYELKAGGAGKASK